MTIKWEPRLSIKLNPVRSTDLAQLERDWAVKLPMAYKELIVDYQGMMPVPSGFSIGNAVNTFGRLLTIHHHEERPTSSVRDIHEILKPYVPQGIFPFARTPGGEHLCFDYRSGTKEPQIVLVSVECEVYPVANSFVELLESLHD